MNRFGSTLVACLLTAFLLSPGASAQPLAEFKAREVIGIEWPQTLLTYEVSFPKGKARPDQLRLVGGDGKEVVSQLSRVSLHSDGSIDKARLSFRAALLANGAFDYKLLAEKPTAATKPVDTGARDGFLTLDNGAVALRVTTEGDFKPAHPLTFSADPGVMALGAKQAEHGLIPGPIQGLRLADGRWIGGSYFSTADPTAAPKVTHYTSRLTERGPLFADAVVRYDFDNGGFYQFTARVLAGDPAVRIDEQYDFKQLGPGGKYRIAFGLSGGGWKPDYEFHRASEGRVPGRAPAFEEALERIGIDTSQYQGVACGSRPIDYTQPQSEVLHISSWDPWRVAAYYLGVTDSMLMTGPQNAQHPVPFVGVVPMHAGNWRGDHETYDTSVIYADHSGELELKWPLMVQPHPFDLTHTGEYDPALPFSFGRRQWALVGGPLQYHQTLYPLRAYEGFVNLDDYKDWVVDWPDDGKTVYPRLMFDRADIERIRPTLDKHPAGQELKKMLFFNDTDERRKELTFKASNVAEGALRQGYEVPWQSSYRQTQMTAWALETDELLSSSKLPVEQRKMMRSQLAAACYALAEPDFNPRGSMMHLGNPNMPINRFMALPIMAALIPDHPMANEWLDVSAAYLRYKLVRNTAPGGVWAELISYYQASTPALLMAGAAIRHSGRLDDATARLLTLPAEFTLYMLSPVDPRFGYRFMPNWGHEGSFIHTHWLPAAGIIRSVDPELAKALAWGWDQMGRPVEDGQEFTGWMKYAIAHADLLAQLSPGYIPKEMKSTWMPGFGAVLRGHVGDPDETYLAYRQGYMVSHSDDNQGDFVLYSKGAPLSTLCLFQYGVEYGNSANPFYKLWAHFGWHNRPRFGSQGNPPGLGILSQVHAYAFNDTVDYLRGRGLSGPNAWTRQILYMKGKKAAGPNYFVFRDTFTNDNPALLQPKWWTLRTPGTTDQVAASSSGLLFTSEFGTRLQTHFIQPVKVEVKSKQATQNGQVYDRAAVQWMEKKRPVVQGSGTGAVIAETMTVSSIGPIAAGQDILVVLNPEKPGEADPKYESLADGVAKITTSEGEDYVFADRKPISFKRGDVAFEGLSGAVRVYPDEVHLVLAEGPGSVSYKNVTLTSTVPARRVIRRSDANKKKTFEVPPVKTDIRFSLKASDGKIEEVQPGVKRQTLANGVAYDFDAAQTFTFDRDGVLFRGRRGGIIVDDKQKTVRMVMLDGDAIHYQNHRADVGIGPYEVTYHEARVTGKSSGAGRILYMSVPDGLAELPELVIDGVPSAPGTLGKDGMIVPLMPGDHEFEIHALAQPPVWRNWQAW